MQLPPRFFLPGFSASADADCCSLPRFFGDGVLFAAVHFCFVHLFQNSPFRFLILRNKKANESLSSAALFGREKISHSPVCDSVFLCLLGQNFADVSSRPTKILKKSAFRDFFVTVPKCQKGAKNRVKTRFFAMNIHFIYKCYCPSNCSVICLKNSQTTGQGRLYPE